MNTINHAAYRAVAALAMATATACSRGTSHEQAPTQQVLRVTATPVSFSLSQTGPPCFPFHAITLALTCTNVSAETYRGPGFSGMGFRVVGVESPDGHCHAIERAHRHGTIVCRVRLESGGEVVLESGESVVEISQISRNWRAGGLLAAVFDEPGEYKLRIKWDLGGLRDATAFQPGESSDLLAIRVMAPRDSDRPIITKLVANHALATAMLSPLNAPGDDLVDELESILHEHPQSTYSDYARFALARKAFYVDSGAAREGVTHQETGDALQRLEQIDYERFAYGADAMTLWRRVLHKRHSAKEDEVAARLDGLFPDCEVRQEDLIRRSAAKVPKREWNDLFSTGRVRDKYGKRKVLGTPH